MTTPVREAGSWVLETLFVFEMLLLGLTLAVVMVSGINPLTVPFGLAVLAGALVIVPAHYRWYRKHRDEIENGHFHHQERERRGF